jgi:hypothetical protein
MNRMILLILVAVLALTSIEANAASWALYQIGDTDKTLCISIANEKDQDGNIDIERCDFMVGWLFQSAVDMIASLNKTTLVPISSDDGASNTDCYATVVVHGFKRYGFDADGKFHDDQYFTNINGNEMLLTYNEFKEEYRKMLLEK